MKNKLIILALEPLESRYTSEWYTALPKIFNSKIIKMGLNMEVITIDGKSEKQTNKVTPGAFLNFTETNIWKNNQLNKLSDMFSKGEIISGDKIVVTDAWNSGVIQIKYMSELMDIPVEIHSIWHAGSYDPNDFLGRKIRDKTWSYAFEKSIFHASDFNYFATYYHMDLFAKKMDFYDRGELRYADKFVRSGFPFEYLKDTLAPYKNIPKENLILFPHRVAPEKQPNIFLDLKASMPEYKFIICQQSDLTKDEYHSLLSKAKIIFSANLQETLGISCYEGALVSALPLVPDRLSYKEMYPDVFKYYSDLTESWQRYLDNKHLIVSRIRYMMENYETLVNSYEFSSMLDKLSGDYFNSEFMATNILTGKIKELI